MLSRNSRYRRKEDSVLKVFFLVGFPWFSFFTLLACSRVSDDVYDV